MSPAGHVGGGQRQVRVQVWAEHGQLVRVERTSPNQTRPNHLAHRPHPGVDVRPGHDLAQTGNSLVGVHPQHDGVEVRRQRLTIPASAGVPAVGFGKGIAANERLDFSYAHVGSCLPRAGTLARAGRAPATATRPRTPPVPRRWVDSACAGCRARR